MQEICSSGYYEKGSMCKQRYVLIVVCSCTCKSHTHILYTIVVDASNWAKLLSRVQCTLQMKTITSVLSVVHELSIALIRLSLSVYVYRNMKYKLLWKTASICLGREWKMWSRRMIWLMLWLETSTGCTCLISREANFRWMHHTQCPACYASLDHLERHNIDKSKILSLWSWHPFAFDYHVSLNKFCLFWLSPAKRDVNEWRA
jgi:hypothetical protein